MSYEARGDFRSLVNLKNNPLNILNITNKFKYN